MPQKRKLNNNRNVKRFKPNSQPHSNGNNKAGKKRSKNVSVDIPEMIDRIENGHGFKNEVRLVNGMDTEDEANFELLGASFRGNKHIGGDLTVGNVGAGFDGVGLRAKATGLQSKVVLGPVDFGGQVGGAEAGVKLWEPDVGLDAGFTANLTALEGNIGPLGASTGLSADTGIKIGKEGVGFKLLGTGVELGRKIGFSLFGTGVSIKLW